MIFIFMIPMIFMSMIFMVIFMAVVLMRMVLMTFFIFMMVFMMFFVMLFMGFRSSHLFGFLVPFFKSVFVDFVEVDGVKFCEFGHEYPQVAEKCNNRNCWSVGLSGRSWSPQDMEILSVLPAHCEGNPPVDSPHNGPAMWWGFLVSLGPVSLTAFPSQFKFDGNFVSLSSRC